MKRTNAVMPFRRAASSGVRAEPWILADSGEVLGERVEHWDSDLTLKLDRTVVVDVDTVLSSTGIDTAGSLALAAVWKCDRTRLRGPGMKVSVPVAAGEAPIAISLDVPGNLAGGSLEIRTVLIRAEDDEAARPTVARRAGTVLWEERISVALEGSAARFPVTVLAFSAVPGLADDSPWALEWSPQDLDQPVLGAMRLLVNSAVPEVVAAVGAEQEGGEGLIASMIRFDIARSLVHGALSDEGFVAGERQFEADTVGRMIEDLIARYWPGVSPGALARGLVESPHRLESDLQAATGLLAP